MLNKSEGLTMAEKNEITLSTAKLLDLIETHLDKAHQAALKLAKPINDGRAAGMVGALEANELRGEAWEIAGAIATPFHMTAKFHTKLTGIAVRNEADLPQPRGGGDR